MSSTYLVSYGLQRIYLMQKPLSQNHFEEKQEKNKINSLNFIHMKRSIFYLQFRKMAMNCFRFYAFFMTIAHILLTIICYRQPKILQASVCSIFRLSCKNHAKVMRIRTFSPNKLTIL